tara:strand:- start:656 stop:1546 length:891 start_codon:yes stop_codon:yes gene_type:complete
MADTLLEEINKIKSMETPIVDKGFKPASVYKGKTLMDTYEAFENKTGMSAIDYLMKRGLPLVGKAGGEKSLEAINKIVDEADRFEKINPGVRQAEEMIGATVKTMKNKPIRTMVTNVFESVQKKADEMFGAAQDIAGDIAKQEDKLKFITKEVTEKLPKLAKGGVDLIKKIGFSMLFGGPSTMGADLIPEPILKDMMRDLGMTQEVPEAAKGGMMNINDIIKPVGYDDGGIVPKRKPEKELTYKQIVEMLKADKTSAKEPTGFYKFLAEAYPIDPINKTIDELKALGIQLSKKGSK